MKKAKKQLLLVVAVILLTTLLATPAFAAEESDELLSWTHVNPEYPHLEIDFTSQNPTDCIMLADDMEVCTSIAEVAEQLRDGMADRKSTIVIYASSKTLSITQQFYEDVFAQATAHTGESDEGDYLLKHYAGYSCQPSWSNGVYILNYTFYYMSNAAQEDAVAEAVEDLLDQLDLYYATDYQKVCGVYDWMCENITYDYDGLADNSDDLEYTAYDAIVNKSAVCQGYANLFYRLMLELDVDTRIIAGDAFNGESTGGHAWNIVELSNKYYLVDSTWDATYAQYDREYEYFLKGSTNFGTDHFPDPEYETAEFTAEYPIDTKDYVNSVRFSGTFGNNLTWTLTKDGLLTISGNGTMPDFEQYGAPWSSCINNIEAIVVENGIKNISNNAFYPGCNAKYIQLPEGLTSIGYNAFHGCDNFTKITLPESLTAIADYAFYNCSSLVDLTIPGNVTTIGVLAFGQCDALTSVSILGNIRIIDKSTFDSCDSLCNITLPDSVTYIEHNAFSGCGKLNNITLPQNLTYIGSNAFKNCIALTSIVIPENVTDIDTVAFNGCTNLSSITFTGNAPTFGAYCFSLVTATAYYPAGNETWTTNVMKDYDGDITWVSIGCNHNYQTKVTPATCTKEGYTTYTCTECGDSYVGDETAATGHTMGGWHISKQPACNAYGEIRRDCENCDAYESIQLAMGDHAYEAVVTKPTIGQQGYTTYTCAACGNSYVDNYTDAISAVAKIGDTEYASVSDALAVAKSGDTVIMIADAYEKTANLTVDEGITLNLGAYDLHAKSLNVLTGGMVTATGYAGAANDHGKLYVPSASRLIMSGISVNGNTAQLIPVWDEVDHYVFGIAQLAKTKYNQDAQGENQITAEKVYFDFAPAFKGEVRKDFFANDDGELLDNGIKIVLRVTWMSGDNVAQQDFVYGKELATKVANNSKTFCTFTLIGYAAMHLKLEDLKIVPMIVTDSGMILYGETFTCG